jgi:tRNA-dihydrouridine synthase A
MMDWTDRHCRFFHRIMSRRARLYSEMVTADAVIHGERERLIGFSPAEHPVALQLGGSDPVKLARAATIGADWGYDEINLNVGCPSDRVQEGRFGACLMAEPDLVARCVAAMREAVPATVEVTVKCRIGIDDQDAEADFTRFVETVADAGCGVFIVHARKAWLQGLSPKENRDIPPLDYARVRRLKAARPDLTVVLNGGIGSIPEAAVHLAPSADGPGLDGVMLGRAAYQTPYLLAEVDRRIHGEAVSTLSRAEVIARLLPYCEAHIANGGRLSNIARHILGLYHGRPRGRLFRRYLSDHAPKPGATADVLQAAVDMVEGGDRDAGFDDAADIGVAVSAGE